MAGPIKIAFLADVGRAQASIKDLGDSTSKAGDRVEASGGRMSKGLDSVGKAALGMNETLDAATDALSAVDSIQNRAKNEARRYERAQIDVQNAMADQRQAALDLKQSIVDLEQAHIDGGQAIVDVKQAQIDKKQADLDAQQAQEELTRAVAEGGAQSADAIQAEIDLAQAKADQEQATLDLKQAQSDQKQASLDASQATEDGRQAQIDARDATLELAEAQDAVNPTPVQQAMKVLEQLGPILVLAAIGLQMFNVALVAQKIALGISTGLTWAMSAAQWALNAAMAANPIFLIIIAIIALIAGIVLLWKNSETFRNIVTAVWDAVWGAIKAVWDWIKNNWPLLLAILTGPIGLAVRWIVQHWDEIVSTVKAIPGKIKDAFGNAKNMLIQIGKDMIQGLINGIKNMAGAAKDAAVNIAKSAVDAMKSKLHIGSPSKVFAEIGGFMGEGLVLGLGGATSAVQRATKDLVGIPGASGLDSTVTVTTEKAPDWADRLSKLLDGGLTIRVESDGSASARGLVEVIADAVRVQGGDGRVLGVARIS